MNKEVSTKYIELIFLRHNEYGDITFELCNTYPPGFEKIHLVEAFGISLTHAKAFYKQLGKEIRQAERERLKSAGLS